MTKHSLDWSRCKYRRVIQRRMTLLGMGTLLVLIMIFMVLLLAIWNLP